MSAKWVLFLLVIPVLMVSCKKDEAPLISPVPELEFVKLSASTINAFSDSLIITLKYRDGDGDLGENDPDVKNLFVSDSRNGIIYEFRVRQLAPDQAEIAITGELDVVLEGLSVAGNSQEQATFYIYMKDRAGHASYPVSTSVVTINP